MKIRKSNLRNLRGTSSQKVEEQTSHARIESVDVIDRTDRFEVGTSKKGDEIEQPPFDSEAVIQGGIDDPIHYLEIERSSLLGLDELPPSVETSLSGIINLLDSERDD